MLSPAYLTYLSPEILLTLWAMILLLAEAFFDLTSRQVTYLALAGIFVTAIETLLFSTGTTFYWGGLCKWDGASKFFHLFFLAVAALVIWMDDEVQEHMHHGAGEFVVLPLLTTTGLMLLASANDFMLLFVALELVTISFYILVAYQRRNLIALEAGVKYLIIGGLSSAFLVMGVAYIFGLTGTTRFDAILPFVRHDLPVGVGFGLLLVLIGIGFKIAMVPFHIWAPDVYEGAPNSITAFLSVGSKAGGLIILLRVVLSVFGTGPGTEIWVPALSAAAILSLLLGNLAAIPQRNLKRLMGYSSIGHTGFILVAIVGAAGNPARPSSRSDGRLGARSNHGLRLSYHLPPRDLHLVYRPGRAQPAPARPGDPPSCRAFAALASPRRRLRTLAHFPGWRAPPQRLRRQVDGHHGGLGSPSVRPSRRDHLCRHRRPLLLSRPAQGHVLVRAA